MDDRGRLAQPLKRTGKARAPRARSRKTRSTPFERFVDRAAKRVLAWHPPRGAGVAAAVMLVLGSGAYGAVRGGHSPVIAAQWNDLRNGAANEAGLRIAQVSMSGQRSISRDEIVSLAGITDKTSLLFFDVEDARARLKAQPWIAEATLVKFYPDRLDIAITEREAFALWQKEGTVFVIAADGAVLQPYAAGQFDGLPLVVGAGAQTKARDFLALLGRHEELRESVQASVLVAERRWNLRLKNGIDVRLPETDVEEALQNLVELDNEKKLLTRDIALIDLRMPDRVTVRLSDDVYQAREIGRAEAKAKLKKPAARPAPKVAKPAPRPAEKGTDA